jgi:proline iminopeptidase
MTPDEYTNEELSLDVGQEHRIYVQDWGTKAAEIPIFFLHGGPGNGCDDRNKQQFDPSTQRVIFHDQRASGKSLSNGSLDHNTTADLISDIDKIANKLDIDKFLLVGGSWGSTLSLLYGLVNPSKVAGMVIDGVYLATQKENEWLTNGGWKIFFPEVWQEYVAQVPDKYIDRPGDYWFSRLSSADPKVQKLASYTCHKMELALLKLDDRQAAKSYQDYDPSADRIELHYISNHCFIPEGYVLDNATKLNMPIAIIQGRYDMVCPPESAERLHRVLPNSQLVYTINGHLKQHEAKNIQRIFIKQLSEQSA